MTRSSLRVAALGALMLSGACNASGNRTPEPSPPDPSQPAIVGAWRSSLQFESGAFATIKDLQFLYAFHADGTMTESSNYDAAPPVPPAYGVWRATGPSEFEAKYIFFSTAPSPADAFRKGAGWVPSGHGVLVERIQMAADGQTFTSTIRYDAFGTKGEPAEGGGAAKGQGERVRL